MKQRDGWLVSAVVLACFSACRAPAGAGDVIPRVEPAPPSEQTPDAGVIERGRYLVEHVAACPDCHSPRRGREGFDRDRWLSGVDCFVDAVPDDPDAGCLSTGNLTNHATGLKNRTDQQIKDMFLRGIRPDGKALHPFMPYPYLGNMRESDANAIVAYLRTVKGVERTAARSQPPFVAPPKPVPRVDEAFIPMPRDDYPEREAALRGRYLAGEVGTCMNCHTPRGANGTEFERAFEGGMKLQRAAFGLPVNGQEFIYTSNLTPHETGISDYSVVDIARALKHGEDKDQGGSRLCPPMPAGPDSSFGGLSDADAADIGHYLLSLPPRENRIPYDCSIAVEP
jgi:mono/diheme cytochrome c family protein